MRNKRNQKKSQTGKAKSKAAAQKASTSEPPSAGAAPDAAVAEKPEAEAQPAAAVKAEDGALGQQPDVGAKRSEPDAPTIDLQATLKKRHKLAEELQAVEKQVCFCFVADVHNPGHLL